MEINVSVQYNGGLLSDIIMSTRCSYIGEPFRYHEEVLSLVVVVVVVFTLKTVLTSIQYPSLSYSSRQRNEFLWSHANPK